MLLTGIAVFQLLSWWLAVMERALRQWGREVDKEDILLRCYKIFAMGWFLHEFTGAEKTNFEMGPWYRYGIGSLG